MARNHWRPSALEELGRGNLDLESVTLALQLLAESYVDTDADENLDDIAAGDRIGGLYPVAGAITMDGPQVTTDTPTTTLSSVPTDADDVTGVALVVDTGSEATSTILGVWFRAGDTAPIVRTTTGDDLEITFSGGVIASLGGL